MCPCMVSVRSILPLSIASKNSSLLLDRIASITCTYTHRQTDRQVRYRMCRNTQYSELIDIIISQPSCEVVAG